MNKDELEQLDDLKLDELVHVAKMAEATKINDDGRSKQIDYLTGNDTIHGRADACLLARLVFEAVVDGTDSFEPDNIGVDLAYLLGAIAKNSFVEWERDDMPALCSVLDGAFPAKEHPVWSYIVIVGPDGLTAAECLT